MYKIFYALLNIFWVFDIIDMPFMEQFDTRYQINTLAWLLIWLVIPCANAAVACSRDK